MPKAFRRALVTGGAGFIGSHLVDKLIRCRMQVCVVDDLSSGERSFVNPKAEFFQMSINDPEFFFLVQRIKPDVIFHLAAQINVRYSVKNPRHDAEVNILGTLAVLQAAKESNVKKIVFSSSGGAMFGKGKPPYTEMVSPNPFSPYGISKRAAELYFLQTQALYNLPCVILRYANVYGPRQGAKGEAGVISVFARRMLAGGSVTMNGSGKQTRDFVYVDDVVAANILAMKFPQSDLFHIGTGKETSILTLYRAMEKCMNISLALNHIPPVSGEVMHSSLDAHRARRVLKWQPTVKLEEGLQRTIAWFKMQEKK
ncbi:MAG: Nucleoside-diphosphate-sugar epimerase [Candidatus Uhrbacteria bacterium GW2011_GWC2_41_11]|uniref:Nucleoside-diphosphate-sugar epimerase n=1 Tax=Candidatus Uhrbacteria bacterium GW2011_GWC2_41_11 TaxID=1618985 RepID=A0A0G0UEB6_9BACT|nr:MAG: Nucleoside-diphosphate-sugar epimerase [Candidatus Uhrbacteria bacterium GW2011_GWC2_41_11]HBO99867.1 UDP-glucose 4-epimerase [Candidatus Uhrbacteria bacterium]